MKSYNDKLNSSKWQRVRKRILLRDKYKCTACGSTLNLRVHHTYYFNDFSHPWKYPDKALITLCEKCHDDFHRKFEVPIMARLKRKGKVTIKVIQPKPEKPELIPLANMQNAKRYRKKVNGEWVTLIMPE